MTTRTRKAIAQDVAAGVAAAAKKEAALAALADYLTGPMVGRSSIALGVPDGPMKLNQSARDFFELREAFGIHGYTESPGALEEIRKTLALP